MPPKLRLLVATAARGEPIVRALFGPHAELVVAHRLAEALAALRAGGFDLVVATIHFDESRMFDLLREARAAHPEVPCVCCRVVDTMLAGAFLHAMRIAVESLGSVFVDRLALRQQHGETAGDEAFARIVLGHVRR